MLDSVCCWRDSRRSLTVALSVARAALLGPGVTAPFAPYRVSPAPVVPARAFTDPCGAPVRAVRIPVGFDRAFPVPFARAPAVQPRGAIVPSAPAPAFRSAFARTPCVRAVRDPARCATVTSSCVPATASSPAPLSPSEPATAACVPLRACATVLAGLGSFVRGRASTALCAPVPSSSDDSLTVALRASLSAR